MDAGKWNAFLRLMHSALWFAEKSKKCCFNDSDENRERDKCSALSYAAACMAKYSAAEAAYWSSPELTKFDLSELFAAFDTFVREVQNDYETNHSYQWVGLKLDQLKELYEDSVCNQPESN